MKNIFITGSAGFIGFHLAQVLKKQGNFVLGLDNFNSYYDVRLKHHREKLLYEQGITTIHGDINDQTLLETLIRKNKITHIVHLAAQAGVRYSLTHPKAYTQSNLDGFVTLLEVLKQFPSTKLVFASSSSVYGNNQKIPFSVEDPTDHPVNLYGATKKANELLAYAYHHLFGISMIGLRFFTVYGPWGRPDMAYYHFTKNIMEGTPIQVFNEGKMQRDFTYIDDIILGILSTLDHETDFAIYNLGNNNPVSLLHLIEIIEHLSQKKAKIQMLPMQKEEMPITFADISLSTEKLGYRPQTSFEKGMEKFFFWYQYFTELPPS
ncbi:MAG: GDP-mannose 4,6-dehydratase [Parachlamydiales bacterium]|nr:GDP-mannose 4,6-dehydratase [Parachlamydiales bacterium]